VSLRQPIVVGVRRDVNLKRALANALIQASAGNSPSLEDVARMVHPEPADAAREAFYRWLLDKPHAFEKLPPSLQELALFKSGKVDELPGVPFQMLTALERPKIAAP
jgi:60 kDa SS-A/Ro ribonucleoprotein